MNIYQKKKDTASLKPKRPERLLRYGRLLCTGIMLLGCGSCSLDIPPADQYSDPDAITGVGTARSLLSSAYALYPHYEYEFSVLGSDFCPTSIIGKDMEQKNLYLWQDNTISDFAETVWLGYYKTIAACDVLLERLPAVQTVTAEEQTRKKQIEAETKTLKALCYLNLLRVFAPPYDLNPQADGVVLKKVVGLEHRGRSSIETCVSTLRQWLLEAEKVENEPTANGWLSQSAVRYLLADLELYAGNYAEAARWAILLLEHKPEGAYPKGDYESLWKETSCTGRIFAFYTRSPYYTAIQYDRKEGDYFALSPQIVYAEGDIRSRVHIYPQEMAGAERRLLGKYNRNNKEGKVNRYVNTMRYAGACFMAAEAYSRMQGQEAVARRLVNDYLVSCGAAPLSDELTGAALTDAILQEKQKEFVGEGMAYFDCKRLHRHPLTRWNIWGQGTSATIASDDYRWTFPIPRSEYRYNEAVTQNAGWPLLR